MARTYLLTTFETEAASGSNNVKLIAAFLFLLSAIAGELSVAKPGDSTYFFSADRLYKPLEAGILEARIGFQKYTNSENLKLDIGASVDIAGLTHRKLAYSLGAEFFTFSNLRSEANFKFPVDAIDYYFGFSLNFKNTITEKSSLSGRLRVAHISSHLQDGHIYENTDTIFTPFVLSKEFIDLSAIYEEDLSSQFSMRGQAGINWIFHSIPDEISPISGQFGVEARYYLNDILSLYLSNEATLAEVNGRTNLNESFETGITLGKKKSRGISVFFSYYEGQDFRGQYYGEYLNTKGVGVKINY